MEHESFENEAIAKLLNEKFICIKVDREEMPHVDQVYMTVTQGLNNGQGGWPMSVAMTADRKPFFAGTYFAKEPFRQIMTNIDRLWREDRAKLLESAEGITKQLQAMATRPAGDLPAVEVLDEAFNYYEGTYDREYGGFGSPPRFAPKFPSPHDYLFLLRHWKRTGSEKALEMVTQSLTEMRLGGMYDQIGFGTHRYSTDREWLVPHFEKMLYDQALLALANLEAFQATGDAFFRRTAEEIFTYVLRDMQHPEGGFFCAEDADSEGEEGKYYVWTHDEILEVLGEEEGALFADVYGIEKGGNWVEESSSEKMETNIPHQEQGLSEVSDRLKREEADLRQAMEAARIKLWEVREKRIHPLKDDKILTDWNGLMIAALARGGVVLGEQRYTREARRAADFVLEHLKDESGRLIKRYRDGEASLPAHLEDYAYLLWGLIELYEACFEPGYLAEAKGLVAVMEERYWDEANGGFFITADDGEKLIVRNKEFYDGALPSGNSVAAVNLLRLARLTGQTEYEERAKKTIKAVANELKERPAGYAIMLQAIDFLRASTREIVIVGEPEAEDTKEMLDVVQKRYDPHQVVLFKPHGPAGEALSRVAAYVEAHESDEGKATAYVCRNFTCRAPTTDVAKMLEYIAD